MKTATVEHRCAISILQTLIICAAVQATVHCTSQSSESTKNRTLTGSRPSLVPPFVVDVLNQVLSQPSSSHDHWTSWAVRLQLPDPVDSIKDTSTPLADLLASKYGLNNMGQIGNLAGYYHFHLAKLNTSHHGNILARILSQNINAASLLARSAAILETLLQQITLTLNSDDSVISVEHQELFSRYHRRYTPPTDPKWSQQWSLRNTRQTLGPPSLDLNVQPAWMQGITGEGVVVSFVDDGLEKDHPDLAANYDAQASRDLVHHDDDPTPDYYFGEAPDRHGTNCAGEVGMAKNNGDCGVGVAYGAKIGGIKVRLNRISDLVEASALGYHDNHIDVYSNSWGPSDSGFVVSGPGKLAKMTLRNGALEGRGGKGVVYVWAAGNGGLNYDSCAADGFSSSIYTISIGSADELGRQADFDEECSSKMAVTYSYNSYAYPSPSDSWTAYRQVTTTSLNGECKDDFTGTSAASPLAAGVVALTLQANQNLTWRDVQYLFVYTSDPTSLVNGGWTRNGAGLTVSHKFGFGAIDAEAMVTRAKRWINVPEQISETHQGSTSHGTARRNQPLIVTFDVDASNSSIAFLEHTVVTLTAQVRGYSEPYSYSDFNSLNNVDQDQVNAWLENEHPRRGDIKVLLTSPQQTSSVLLPFRRHDFVNTEGYVSWPLTSIHYWGENPTGQWTLEVYFDSSEGYVEVSGIEMDLYGAVEVPEAIRNIPPRCDSQCSRGCSGEGPLNCDGCRTLRVAATLECVMTCPDGTAVSKDHHGYCVEADNNYTPGREAAATSTGVEQSDKVRSGQLPSTVLVAAVVGSLVAVLLLVVLTILLCVLTCVVLGKGRFKYTTFTNGSESKTYVNSTISSTRRSVSSNENSTGRLSRLDSSYRTETVS